MNPAAPLIVVVDDDMDALALTSHVLEGAGYRVVCACSADEALQRMACEAPALVITDLMMDSLHAGFTFAHRLREDPQYERIPIIVVTAAASRRGFDFLPRADEDLQAMKVDALFSKPVKPAELLAKVDFLLTRPRCAAGTSQENQDA